MTHQEVIALVEKWMNDNDSVTIDELKRAADTAAYAAAYAAADAAAYADAATRAASAAASTGDTIAAAACSNYAAISASMTAAMAATKHVKNQTNSNKEKPHHDTRTSNSFS
jgi:hypothetical protein